ncbi:hypothetical protein O3P69_019334 [Scylla paramamosain]|uniref:Uncharacterized protein n=1 Tax=Scylla paramamosain TaxID=85552 RepID=A0AAW0SWA2_SCYPA
MVKRKIVLEDQDSATSELGASSCCQIFSFYLGFPRPTHGLPVTPHTLHRNPKPTAASLPQPTTAHHTPPPSHCSCGV